MDTDIYDELDMRNYLAVLKDYESGAITNPPAGMAYIYYNGHRVTGQVRLATYNMFQHWEEWIAQYGANGRSWPESVSLLPPNFGRIIWLESECGKVTAPCG